MNSLIRVGILWCLAIAIGRAQEPAGAKEASKTPTLAVEQTSPLLSEPTPVNGQPSPFRPLGSEPPRTVAAPNRIVIQPRGHWQEYDAATEFMSDLEKARIAEINSPEMQFLSDLEEAGIAKINDTEMTPTSESPILLKVCVRVDESHEKIKQFIVDINAFGVERMVLEILGPLPADVKNSWVFEVTQEYSEDEWQRLDKVVREAAERCGMVLGFAGTGVVPSGSEFVGPPDKAAVPSYAPSFRPAVPQQQTDYEAANKHAHDLAESLRQTPDPAKKSELRTAVQRAFTLRQSLLRAELQEMQARLEKTQQSLDMRDRMVDQIVDRRVEDLLNPELKWNGSPDAQAQPLTQAKTGEQNSRNGGDLSSAATGQSAYRFTAPEVGFNIGYAVNLSVSIRPGQAKVFLAGLPIMAKEPNHAPSTAPYMESVYSVDVTPEELVAITSAETLFGRIEIARTTPDEPTVVNQNCREAVADAWREKIRFDEQNDAVGLAVEASSADPQAEMLAKLQGFWDFQELSVENPEPRHFPNGPQMIYEIVGNRMASPVGQAYVPELYLRFPEPGSPQPIDLTPSPNGEWAPNSTFRCIIEVTDDLVRICRNNSGGERTERPTEFAITKDTDILELRRRPEPVTELEGDWHLVSIKDKSGDPVDVRPMNLSFRNDQYTLSYQGYQNEERVEVYPDQKEIRYFADGDDAFTRDQYLLDSDQLTIYDENRRSVYHRGHVALPKSIAKATDEQKTRWRSGIVEILTEDPRENTQLVGYGVIVSPQMRIVSQIRLSDGDSAFFAQFDDGGIVPIKVLEEGPQGWVTFEPEQPIEANHRFRLSEAAVGEGDEVHFWGQAATVSENPTLELFKTTVNDLDRKAPALGQTVWQLFRHDKLDGSLPVLDANGDLLAITIAGTNDLLLAVPVSQLKTMFPKSFGPVKQDAE